MTGVTYMKLEKIEYCVCIVEKAVTGCVCTSRAGPPAPPRGASPTPRAPTRGDQLTDDPRSRRAPRVHCRARSPPARPTPRARSSVRTIHPNVRYTSFDSIGYHSTRI